MLVFEVVVLISDLCGSYFPSFSLKITSQLFLRGMPHLHSWMKRMKSKKAPLESTHQHPNFYEMPLADSPDSNTIVKSNLPGLMPPSESPRSAAASQSNGGDMQIQGAIQQHSLSNLNDAATSIAGGTTQSLPLNSHVMMQGVPQSSNQLNLQQQVGMYPTYISPSNMHLLAPFAASASVINQPASPPYLGFLPYPAIFNEQQLQLVQQHQPLSLQHLPRQQQQQQQPIHVDVHTLKQQSAQVNAALLSSDQTSAVLPNSSIVTVPYQCQYVNNQSLLQGPLTGAPIESNFLNSPTNAGRTEDTMSSQYSDNGTKQKGENG